MSPTGKERACEGVTPPMGFWQCWSMSVGVMIGSGVFLLPTILAPYGSISFLGWLLTSAGAITIALVLGRLASRTKRSGGFYVYVREAFGDLAGFVVGWSYWISIVFGVAAISVAFAGYASAMMPTLGQSKATQALFAAAVIWTLTAVNIRGVAQAASLQLVMTVLKIVPLLVIIALGVFTGSLETIPPVNPTGQPIWEVLATTGLLTMWAFVGLEAGVIPAGDVQDPKRTIPRALVTGTLSVAAIYIAATAAVMMLVPMEVLVQSEAPFAQAARGLGPAGGILITLGALVATAGSLNGNIMLSGQMPSAVAQDGLAPAIFARKNSGHAPKVALVTSSFLSTILLFFNYSDGLVAAFTFLISMSTLAVLMPYALSALAELKNAQRSSRTWILLAVIALAYSLVAMAGSGVATLMWGVVLVAAGLPVYLWCRRG
ncbi:MAG: APC family permease [Gammaproteobacteria bacterium]